MCPSSWPSLPPPTPPHPSGSSQCTSPEHPVSCIEPGLAICFTYDNIHVSVLFSQIIPPLPSPTESKRLFYTSVSLLNSHLFLTIATLLYIRSSEAILITERLYPLTCISSFSLAPSHWWPPFLFCFYQIVFFTLDFRKKWYHGAFVFL